MQSYVVTAGCDCSALQATQPLTFPFGWTWVQQLCVLTVRVGFGGSMFKLCVDETEEVHVGICIQIRPVALVSATLGRLEARRL